MIRRAARYTAAFSCFSRLLGPQDPLSPILSLPFPFFLSPSILEQRPAFSSLAIRVSTRYQRPLGPLYTVPTLDDSVNSLVFSPPPPLSVGTRQKPRWADNTGTRAQTRPRAQNPSPLPPHLPLPATAAANSAPTTTNTRRAPTRPRSSSRARRRPPRSRRRAAAPAARTTRRRRTSPRSRRRRASTRSGSASRRRSSARRSRCCPSRPWRRRRRASAATSCSWPATSAPPRSAGARCARSSPSAGASTRGIGIPVGIW